MKAARLLSPGKIEIQDLPEPDLGNRDVLVKVKYAGICMTDYSIYSGESSFVKNGLVKFPLTMGHEWSGVVAKIGSDVVKLKSGDRVIGDTGVSCGSCYECLSGKYLQCRDMRAVGTVNAIDGAFAEYIVMPERHLFPMPENVSFKQGAIVEPVATGMYAVQRGGVKAGDVVLVQGTGPIGLAAVQLSKISGASQVIVSGRREKKLNIGKELGADSAVNISTEDLAAVVNAASNNRGAEVIIEASGSESALKNSFELVRPGGTIAMVAFYEKKIDKVDFDQLILNDVVLTSVAGSPVVGMKVLDLMHYGRINLDRIITHEYPFEDIVQAFKDMKKKREDRIKIMLKMPD
jgi:2-desacetyl-2-hydroxyethyl bacteriochlorophyllide A dehydrogenase